LAGEATSQALCELYFQSVVLHHSITTTTTTTATQTAEPRAFPSLPIMNGVNGINGHAAPPVLWQEARNPEGRVYYYNTITKATQWTKPEDLMTPAEVNALPHI
jgi:WW domain